MKKLRTLAAIGALALLTACGTTNTATSDTISTSSESSTTNRGRSNTEVNSNRTATTTRTNEGNRERKAADMAAVKAMEEKNLQEMYTALNMNDSQISRFQGEWKKATSANNSLNNYERAELQDKIMRDILDENQLQQYQKWARENAGTNGRN